MVFSDEFTTQTASSSDEVLTLGFNGSVIWELVGSFPAHISRHPL